MCAMSCARTFETERDQPFVKILRDGGKSLQDPRGVEGVGHFDFGGVQKGEGETRKTRIGNGFAPVLGVAKHGMARHRKVFADLVGAAGFNAGDKITGVAFRRDATDVCDGAFPFEREIDRGRAGIPTPDNGGAVCFRDEVALENFHRGGVRGGGF